MAYKEGITINGVHTYVDFDLTINSRKIDLPPKNSIRKTVPFMNGFYDFTKLNGAASWGERIVSYTFDIIGETIEQMDLKRTEVVNWLCNLHDVDIFDDTIPDYHFHGSFNNASQNEDGEKSELTVEFICHPFMIENEPRVMYTNGGDVTITVNNNGQPVRPSIDTAQECTITIGNRIQSVPAGETKLAMVLQSGETVVRITKDNELVYPYSETTHTENGITFTANEDGTVIASGTATETAWFYVRRSPFLPPVGFHQLRGCPAGGTNGGYRMVANVIDKDGTSVSINDTGEGVVFEVKESTAYVTIAIRITAARKVENQIFNPTLYGETKLKWQTEVL